MIADIVVLTPRGSTVLPIFQGWGTAMPKDGGAARVGRLESWVVAFSFLESGLLQFRVYQRSLGPLLFHKACTISALI